jgi:hypothetical protein
MRRTLLAAAALGLLVATPVMASAADVGAAQTVVASNPPTPAYSGPFHRWFAPRQPAGTAVQYGDPFDPGHLKANQVIIAPVGR